MKKNILYISIIFCSVFFSFNISKASSLAYNLRGSFLIDVNSKGEAWYVDVSNTIRHLVDKDSFSTFINSQGLGASSRDIEKIPIAVNNRLISKDSDNDGLDDRLERAIGTDPFSADSDNDSHSDSVEILNHFDPLGPGRLDIDLSFAKKQAGKILLEVESKGQAWYVNPSDNLRYYIADFNDLLKIIAVTGKGISAENIELVADARKIDFNAEKHIRIDSGRDQKLSYYLGDNKLGSFLISAGKASTPTPKGEFKIVNKHLKAWSPYGLWMPYWMGLDRGRIGLHELPIWPNGYREGSSHLGVPVSHGCVRLGIGPAEFLYNFAELGNKVIIN